MSGETHASTLAPHDTPPRQWRVGIMIAVTIVVVLTAGSMSTAGSVGRWTILLGIVSNVPCAILGCYLVLRRLSLLGDAISHAVLPGIALGFLLTGQIVGPAIVLGAMAVGMLTALLTHALSALGKVPEDASMGVVFTSLFAVGVILITNAARDVDLDPGCVLYGLIQLAAIDTVPILGVEVPRALGSLGLATVLTIGFVTLLWKELKLVSFDPALATAVGINAAIIHYALMAMVAGVTVAAFEAVGSILVVAMLIVPAATAHLLTDRLERMMFVASGVAVLSAALGYSGALALNTSVSGMMAVVAGLQFGLAVVFAPRHGVLGKAMHTMALSLRIAREDVLARFYRAEEDSDGALLFLSPSTCRHWAASAAGPFIGALAMWQLLHRKRLERSTNGSLQLTKDGREQARSLVRAHRLWEVYLSEHFDLPPDHLHDPAERIEHYLGPGLQLDLSSALDRPQSDPHGRTIPPDQADEPG